MQVWFNAPHGPWETITTGERPYTAQHGGDANRWRNHRCPPDRGTTGEGRTWQREGGPLREDKVSAIGGLVDVS